MKPDACHIPTRRAGRWSRRAFSLFEVILSIVVLVAIAAVVLPRATGQADEMAHGETVRSLSAALGSARVDAMSGGDAVSIVAKVSEGSRRAVQIVSRPGEPRSVDELGRGQGGAGDSGKARGLNAFSLEDAFGGPRDGAGVVVMTLAGGVSLVREVDLSVFAGEEPGATTGFDPLVPEEAGEAMADGSPWGDAGGDPFADGPAAVREMNLATFRADGSVTCDAFFVLGPGERASRVTVSPWTGRVSAERLRLTTDEPEPDALGAEPPIGPPGANGFGAERGTGPGGAAGGSRGPGAGS